MIDKALINIGVSNEERIKIYKTLAAILHLGNIDFEENSLSEGCQIAASTKNHFTYATQLLGIEQEILEEYLLKRRMEFTKFEPIL